MKHLCDINVWLALSLANHPHHHQTLEWFDRFGDTDTACFCRASQQGFLRLATNRTIFGSLTLTNREALRIYQKLSSDDRVVWLDEPEGIEQLWFQYSAVERARPHLWMDAYLAAFAVLSEALFATYDKGFNAFKELNWIDLGNSK